MVKSIKMTSILKGFKKILKPKQQNWTELNRKIKLKTYYSKKKTKIEEKTPLND